MMWPEMAEEPPWRAEVFFWVGSAAYAASGFETELVKLLLLLERLGKPGLTVADFDSIAEKLGRRPIGVLLAKLKSAVTLPNETERVFEVALADRNYMIHGFWLDKAAGLLNADGCRKLVVQLKEINNRCLAAFQHAKGMADGAAAELGLPKEAFEREVREALARLAEG